MAAVSRPAVVCQAFRSSLTRGTISNQRVQPSALCALMQSNRFHPNKSPIQSSRLRNFAPVSSQIAEFHTSGLKAILPAGPQVIEGTANDPAPIPDPSPTHGSYHWTFERLASAALIPLTVAPFAAGSLNPITDAALCALILIHSHIGFQSIIVDYIPNKRLPKTRALFWWGLRGATLLVAVGLYEFETNDVGLTEAIKRIWQA